MNIFKRIIIGIVLTIVIFNFSFAQNIVTSSGAWYRFGNSLLTNPSGLDLGASGTPLGDIYAGTLNVSGFTAGGDIDLGGNDLLNAGLVDLNGTFDQDYAYSGSPVSTSAFAIDYDLNFNATTSSANPTGHYVLVSKSDDNDMTGPGIIGLNSLITNKGAADIDQVINFNGSIGNIGSGTVAKHIGYRFSGAATSGSITDAFAISLRDLGIGYPTNSYFLEIEGTEWTTNGDAINIDNDGSNAYIPTSTAATGITRDSNDLSLATTTSGRVLLNGIDGNVSQTRFSKSQGIDVASANDIVLGSDGNTFEITGTTQINCISGANWQNGSTITLWFTSTPTVKHSQSCTGGNIALLIGGAVDYTPGAGDGISLQLSEIGGTQAWRDVGQHNL